MVLRLRTSRATSSSTKGTGRSFRTSAGGATSAGWGWATTGLTAGVAAGRLRRSGSADTGTLVPWYPEGFSFLDLDP